MHAASLNQPDNPLNPLTDFHSLSLRDLLEARDLYHLLSERLPNTMVISIGRSAALVALHQRTVDMAGGSAASRSPRSAALAPVPA